MLWSSVPIGFHGTASLYAGRGSRREVCFAVTLKSKVEGPAWGAAFMLGIPRGYCGIHVCLSWSGPFSSCQGGLGWAGQGQMIVWALMSDSFPLKVVLKWTVDLVSKKKKIILFLGCDCIKVFLHILPREPYWQDHCLSRAGGCFCCCCGACPFFFFFFPFLNWAYLAGLLPNGYL